MSATLCWKPTTKTRGSLPDALKFVLRDSCGLDSAERRFDGADVPYLSGLRDAKVDGAQELIDLIEKHGSVLLWLAY